MAILRLATATRNALAQQVQVGQLKKAQATLELA